MAGPPTRPFREVRQDRAVSASEMNRALAELRRSLQFVPQPPLWVLDTVSGFHIGIDRSREPFWAKITSGTNPYAWTEQNPLTSGGWEDTVRGRTGTTTFRPAYERNDNAAVAAGTVVRLYPTFKNNSSTLEQEYTFEAPAAPSSLSARETSGEATYGTPSTGTLYTSVAELRCDYGELYQDAAGSARIGYGGRCLKLDQSDGDTALSVASGAYTAPVNFAFTGASWTSPDFGAETDGSAGGFIRTPHAGFYLFTASVNWAGNATGYRYLAVANASGTPLNAGAVLQAPPGTTDMWQNVCGVARLGSAFDLNMQVAQNSGGALNVYRAYFTCQRLG